MKTKFSH